MNQGRSRSRNGEEKTRIEVFGFKPGSAFGLKPGPGNTIQFGMTGRPFRLLGRPDVALTTCGGLVEDGLEWPDLRTRGCAGLVLVLDVFDSCRMTEIAKWTQDGCSCPPRVHVCGLWKFHERLCGRCALPDRSKPRHHSGPQVLTASTTTCCSSLHPRRRRWPAAAAATAAAWRWRRHGGDGAVVVLRSSIYTDFSVFFFRNLNPEKNPP